MPDYKKVEFSQLSKADIIFTTSDAAESAGIRKATNSIISHTMLVTKYNYVIEATADGVEEHTWSVALTHAQATIAIVMRRTGLTNEADQDKVVAAARQFERLPYDYYGAAGSGMFGNTRNQILTAVGCSLVFPPACAYAFNKITENAKDENADKSFFCSELVSRAFSIGGFPVVDGKATNANPCAVYKSPHLSYIGHLETPFKTNPNLTEKERERYRRMGYRKDN
jgi:uncharacterized protein YycO